MEQKSLDSISSRITYLASNLDKLLEAVCGLAWEWETPGGHSPSGSPPHVYRFFLQELHQALKVRIWERCSPGPDWVRGGGAIATHTWSLIHDKGLLFWEKHLPLGDTETLSHLGEGGYFLPPFQPAPAFLSHFKTKQNKTRKEQNSQEGTGF